MYSRSLGHIEVEKILRSRVAWDRNRGIFGIGDIWQHLSHGGSLLRRLPRRFIAQVGRLVNGVDGAGNHLREFEGDLGADSGEFEAEKTQRVIWVKASEEFESVISIVPIRVFCRRGCTIGGKAEMSDLPAVG